MEQYKPRISIGSLGGTVSMMADSPDQGIMPKLGAQEQISTLSGISEFDLYAETLFQLPSGYINFDHVIHCVQWAKAQVQAGSIGVVLTQGTDTLEETAYLCDLFWDLPQPLVLTGAMRSPQQLGADGGANLLASILVASSPLSLHRGVQVVMSDTIYEAKWVYKNHTLRVDAFESIQGPAGALFEYQVQYFKAPRTRQPVTPNPFLHPKVLCWEAMMGDDGSYLERLLDDCDALVIGGMGAGHIPQVVAKKLKPWAKKIPIIMCSRVPHGPTAMHTYGYEGAEIDLQEAGFLMGGWLSPRKARLLVWALLNSGTPQYKWFNYL